MGGVAVPSLLIVSTLGMVMSHGEEVKRGGWQARPGDEAGGGGISGHPFCWRSLSVQEPVSGYPQQKAASGVAENCENASGGGSEQAPRQAASDRSDMRPCSGIGQRWWW